eukprot:COSAG04_NODE_6219_length_1381_cov_1.358034_2_plen_156_part_00
MESGIILTASYGNEGSSTDHMQHVSMSAVQRVRSRLHGQRGRDWQRTIPAAAAQRRGVVSLSLFRRQQLKTRRQLRNLPIQNPLDQKAMACKKSEGRSSSHLGRREAPRVVEEAHQLPPRAHTAATECRQPLAVERCRCEQLAFLDARQPQRRAA